MSQGIATKLNVCSRSATLEEAHIPHTVIFIHRPLYTPIYKANYQTASLSLYCSLQATLFSQHGRDWKR
jgi:hypothetical protein